MDLTLSLVKAKKPYSTVHRLDSKTSTAGIPRFTLLMWGHIKKPRKQKPRKSRLLCSTKGEENTNEL